MAVTAQARGVLPLDPPSWAAPSLTSTGRRQRWSLAAAGLAGIGVLVVVIVVLTVSGGAVSGDPTQSRGAAPRSADLSATGRGYGPLVARYENAERTWRAQANKMVAASTASTASAEALIRPAVQFADTVDQVDHDLVHLRWPASMRGDVNALEAELATVSGDLRSIGGQSVSSMAQWLSNAVADASAASAASQRLKGDLGETISSS
ncbi:MAG TPA: hypothetical protein VH112_12920 [Acidimicrobiales bacterium]|jgi:hypothetical protein|nr:hypothetical protein [Acidimicrobiales bacterium]